MHVNLPLNKAAGTDGGAVVYFEVRPGEYLARHTVSPEEILYIVAGEAEAAVGDERGIVTAGDLAVIPAMVPHGLRNIGEETVRVVGFFCEPEVTSTFRRADAADRRARARAGASPRRRVDAPACP